MDENEKIGSENENLSLKGSGTRLRK